MKAKNLSSTRLSAILESGRVDADFECVFECTEKEFIMLSSIYKIQAVEEEKIETREEPVVETKKPKKSKK